MALGYQALTDTALGDFRRKNMRRQIFYSNPKAAAPLTGLISLAEDEVTDGPEFSWLEYRYSETRTTTAASGSQGGWLPASGSAASTHTSTGNTTLRLTVASGDGAKFLPNQIIIIFDVLVAITGVSTDVHARIISVSGDVLTLEVYEAIVIDNDVGQAGKNIILLGSANAEGSLSGAQNALKFPVNPGNYTQIFRSPLSFTATELQQALEFDASGPYKHKIRDLAYDHLIGIENAVIWGDRSKVAVTDTDSNSTPTIRRTMGGIKWFLKQWESDGGGTFGYRPSGADISAADWTADAGIDRRIFKIGNSGSMTKAQWDLLIERIFRKITASSSEKVLLCGPGIISAINTFFEKQVTTNKDFESEHKLGFDLRTLETAHGTLHFKAHPRFNEHSWMRYDGLVVDVGNLRLRPMAGRDTKLRTNIHANDFDGRKDEFLTEASLEVRFPETHAWISGLKAITAS